MHTHTHSKLHNSLCNENEPEDRGNELLKIKQVMGGTGEVKRMHLVFWPAIFHPLISELFYSFRSNVGTQIGDSQ